MEPARETAARPDIVEGLRLLALVGRGGEGEVWEALDAQGRRRALKLVRPDCLAPPEEATVRAAWLVRINHPSLVRVHRSGVLGAVVAGPPKLRDSRSIPVRAASASDLDGWGFVEMDLVEGSSLAKAAADPHAEQRLRPLAEALDLLHGGTWSDGVPLVHRDIKPANLMVDSSGRLILVDPSTLRGVEAGEVTRVGTPVYCAPEVMAGRVSPAADVYSFAVTFVALLTGRRGASLAEVVHEPWKFHLPQGVRHALSADPTGRPPTCRTVLDPGRIPTVRTVPSPPPGRNGGATRPMTVHPTGRPAPSGGAQRPGSTAAGPAHGRAGGPPAAGSTSGPRQGGPAGHPASRGVPGPVQGRPAAYPGAWGPPAQSSPGPQGRQGGRSGEQPWRPPAAPPARQGNPAPSPQAGASPAYAPAAGAARPAPSASGRSVLVWLLLGGAVFAIPALAVAQRAVTMGELVSVAVVAFIAWLLIAEITNQSRVVALFLPPLAWARLLAERAAVSPRRQAFARAACLPGAVLMVAAIPRAASLPREAELWTLCGFFAIFVALIAVQAAGAVGVLFRLLAIPLWGLGTAVLLALGVLALIPALLTGHAARLVRGFGLLLASAVELAYDP